MNNGKYVSVKRVLENVYRKFKIKTEIDFFTALEWVGSLIALVESEARLEKHIRVIQIEDGRGKLPCDLHSIIQTAKRVEEGTPFGNVPRLLFMENDVVAEGEEYLPDTSDVYIEVATDPSTYYLEPMYYSGDTHLLRYHCCGIDFKMDRSVGNSYQLNTNHIYTNFEEGFVEMAYLRIPVDEEGYPMVPDHETWIKACEFDIAMNAMIPSFMNGSLPRDRFQWIEGQRNFYVASAGQNDRIPTIDEAASWQNFMTNPFRDSRPHASFYAHMHEPSTYKNIRA